MTELLTAAQMRAIEAAAIASGEVTGLELMERAGQGVVEAVLEEWPDLAKTSHRAVVLCGPGNNGGDGFVVARLLKARGWEVEVFLYGDAEKLPPDARVNYERWGEVGEVYAMNPNDPADAVVRATEIIFNSDVFVDALFGTGLARPAPYFEAVSYALHDCFNDALWSGGGQSSLKIVAVDLPSSLCADSGRELATADGGRARDPFAAYLTVTFHRPKLGHFLGNGPRHCTRIKTVDIGLTHLERKRSTSGAVPPNYCNLSRSPLEDFVIMEMLSKACDAHKYKSGHALILSGGSSQGGAARLAARGALRIGAGVVTIGCPPDAVAENAAQLNAIMLSPIHDADALTHILLDERINALCLGPGLGIGEREAGLVAVALGMKNRAVPGSTRDLESEAPHSESRGPGSSPGQRGEGRRAVVLDADALTLLAGDAALFAGLHAGCVLTPHAGEFARLFPDIAEKLSAPATKGPAYSKVDATREAAARAGCVVLFKGADTVIADPEGRASINSAHYDRAAPWLATAGSGDVLAGFITGLLARGFAPMQAAETAAWLHVECARAFGPGLIAEDLPEVLPQVLRELGV